MNCTYFLEDFLNCKKKYNVSHKKCKLYFKLIKLCKHYTDKSSTSESLR